MYFSRIMYCLSKKKFQRFCRHVLFLFSFKRGLSHAKSAHTIFLIFWVIFHLFKGCCTAEPVFSISGFYRTFAKNYRFFARKNIKNNWQKSEIEKTGFAVIRSLKSYIIAQNFIKIVCTRTELFF